MKVKFWGIDRTYRFVLKIGCKPLKKTQVMTLWSYWNHFLFRIRNPRTGWFVHQKFISAIESLHMTETWSWRTCWNPFIAFFQTFRFFHGLHGVNYTLYKGLHNFSKSYEHFSNTTFCIWKTHQSESSGYEHFHARWKCSRLCFCSWVSILNEQMVRMAINHKVPNWDLAQTSIFERP